MSWVVAAAWASSRDYDKTRGCELAGDGNAEAAWYSHCKGDFPIETWKPGGCCNKRTRFGCAKACGNKIQYRPGKSGHPCGGAVEIKGIPVNISMHDKSGIKGAIGNPQGAFWCRFNTNGAILKSYSGDGRLTTAGDGSRSIYEQLLFGANKGSYRSEGFCADYKNLNTVVHRDGRTCYDMIGSAADKKAKGILYCKNNRKDPKCKCVNVAGNNFLQVCTQNPTWAGCKEVLKGQADFKKMGLTSASGLYGNADCLAPGICSGEVYDPMTNLQACANKNAVCNQILQMDNVKAYADLKAAQHCNINFEAEQKKKDAAKAAEEQKKKDAEEQKKKDEAAKAAQTKIAQAPTTPSPAAAAKAAADTAAAKAKAAGASPAEVQAAADKASADVESKLTGFGGFSTTQLGIGAGGAILLCCCCVIILILAMSGGGNGRGSGRFRR